ncbi:MAG: prenyltransferase [Nitrososphaerota archaeon]|jgi:1,4-dihydroxy-2-naphthoate octaprenyltransferase|nr:prenyltransferase [Nitrososphaerota archaeon]MDG6932361.1 prenyltransferase [Nitrososphaerota archaeon]MDG6935920.1 prenyltransferase [Nitrososphaerota archaeon]MDG6943766.1 prenyltransferase [Nitrososphaerota archaeon]
MKASSVLGMLRAWSLPMSISSVLLGGAMALFVRFNIYTFLLAIIATLLLHAGTNVLNDANDVSQGVDRPGCATALYREHPVLKGELTVNNAFMISAVTISAGLLLGAYISYITGPAVFLFELIGAVMLASYNGPLANLKAHGFGELDVSLVFGPPLVMGGFAAASGGIVSLSALLVSLLPTMIMMSIIYSNNYRDRVSDSEAGVRSFAMMTQKHGYKIYASFLLAVYALQAVFIIFGLLPLYSLLTLLTIPYSIKLLRMFRLNALDIDSKTGTLFAIYNILLVAGLVMSMIF